MSYLADSEIRFLKIRTIQKIEAPDYVYDLSVPGGENFVAGNLLGHNSSLHGGGIGFGILSGVLAADSIIMGNGRKHYDRLWKESLANILKRHYLMKKMLYSWKEPQFDQAVEALSTFKIEVSPEMDPNKVLFSFLSHLIRHYRGLVPSFVRVAF